MSETTTRTRFPRALLAWVLATATLAAAVWWTAYPLSAAPSPAPRLAVLVLAPYLTFEDLSPSATPALWRLAESGAIGAMNSRTADSERPNVASGALTISASRWASVERGAPAAAVDIAALQAANDDALTRPVLGALGSALRAQGGRTAALSIGAFGESGTLRRPAELAAMDASGLVDFTLAGGTRAGFSAIERLGAGDGARLLVVDSPSLALAGESTTMTPSQALMAHRAAVAELDAAVGDLRRQAPEDTFWLVVAPATTKRPYEDPLMAPAIVAGRGVRGELISPSTHRNGVVTSLDVAPTLLDALDLKPFSTMLGAVMAARPTSLPLAERLAALSRADRSAGVVDRLREAWFIRGFVAFALLAIAFTLWVVRTRRARKASAPVPLAERIAPWLVLLLCAVPPATWLMFLVRPHPASIAEAVGAFALASAVVLAVLLGVRRHVSRDATTSPRRATLAAPFLATALTTAVILADQWLGDPIRSGLFSYSVRSGWRYYGMGNEGAALLVGASIVGVGLVVDMLGETRWGESARRYAMPIVGTVVLVTAAVPFAGANAGVAIWGVVAYAVAWAAMNRVRLRATTVALTLGAIALAVIGLSAIDLAAGGGGGTHLARFAAGVLSGDVSATREMVSRKLANNLGLLVATRYTLLFLGGGAVFALLRRGSKSSLRAALMPLPALRAALLGVFVGGLVALVTEDSSSVMPALMWMAALAPALVVALDLPQTWSESQKG